MSDKQVFANIIDGEERAAASQAVLDIINPSTGEVYATSPNSGDAGCRRRVPGRRTGLREVPVVHPG